MYVYRNWRKLVAGCFGWIVVGGTAIGRADVTPIAATAPNFVVPAVPNTASPPSSSVSAGTLFAARREQIQRSLPSGWTIRLPDKIPLDPAQAIPLDAYQVRIFQFTAPTSLTIGVFRCDTGDPDCLVASFAVDSRTSTTAQQSLQQHHAATTPITLANGIRGYLWDGSIHSQPLSSVMWEQDGMIYTVSFPAAARQNLLYTALATANADPIQAIAAAPSPSIASNSLPSTAARSAATPDNVVPIAAPATPKAPLQAQNLPTQPDRDRFVPSVPVPHPLPNEQPVVPLPAPSPPVTPPPAATQTPIPVSQINVVGSTIFSAQDWRKITQPLVAKGSATLQELYDVADQITQLYLNQGYITSRAVPEAQPNPNGIITIRVIEGRISRIDVEGTQRLSPSYVRNRVALGVTVPLNVQQLEDQLKLLLLDPSIQNIIPTLQAGTGEGQSVLNVRVVEAKAFSGDVSVDNYSPPSIGSERLGINLSYQDLTGLGDTIAASFYGSTTGGSKVWSLDYRVPVNPMDGTLELRADINRNRITQAPFSDLDIKGESDLYAISYRQPIVRSTTEEFALSLGFTYQNGQTFLFNDLGFPFGIGPDRNGVSRTSVLTFGQDYLHRDSQGVWSARSQFSLGTGLFDATSNSGDIPDGHFFSWLGQVQRVQQLGDAHLLIARLDLQLTPDSLLPSQQFVIGGGQSVRGYRQNARSGDNGIRFSVEDQITLDRDKAGAPTFQLAPFVDLGAVWNVSGNPNPLPSQKFLAGIGLGLIWKPYPGLNLRLDYGYPLVDLRDRGNNVQDDGFYFSVLYGF